MQGPQLVSEHTSNLQTITHEDNLRCVYDAWQSHMTITHIIITWRISIDRRIRGYNICLHRLHGSSCFSDKTVNYAKGVQHFPGTEPARVHTENVRDPAIYRWPIKLAMGFVARQGPSLCSEQEFETSRDKAWAVELTENREYDLYAFMPLQLKLSGADY